MPFVDEDDLVKLYDEIDELSIKKEELRKGYINLKLKNNKILKYRRRRNVLIFLLLSVVLLLIFLLYKTKSNLKQSVKKEYVIKKQIDSLKNLHTNIKVKKIKTNPKLPIYAVQIGVLNSVEFEQDKNISKSIKIVQKPNGSYSYIIGEFLNYQYASKFKKQIKNFGIKDAFIVAYYKGKRIDIKKALTISKEKNADN